MLFFANVKWYFSSTIRFCRNQDRMVRLCQTSFFRTIRFCRNRNPMVRLCQTSFFHTIRFCRNRNPMEHLCQASFSSTIRFRRNRNPMEHLCQASFSSTIRFCRSRNPMEHLCQATFRAPSDSAEIVIRWRFCARQVPANKLNVTAPWHISIISIESNPQMSACHFSMLIKIYSSALCRHKRPCNRIYPPSSA